ncbi:TPA: sulfatase-like hydrolase/transferase [Aeromonas hydrophila]|nr:sulfatase-like hydrolase/transferase [Aeromonas hydrophila]
MSIIVVSILVLFILCISTIRYRGLLIAVAVLYIALSGLYVVSDMFTGAGFNTSVMYHLYTGVQGAGFSEYIKEISYGAGFIFCAIMFPLSHVFIDKSKQGLMRISPLISLPLALLLFLISPWVGNYYEQARLYVSGVFDKQDVSDEYVVNNSEIKNKKNIVLIYAESFERTYLNKDKFPGLVSNLVPIIDEGIDFTNVDNDGGGWTIAGLVNSQCGLPLSLPGGQGNNMGSISQFMPDAYCLGDILKDNGYELKFIGGAKADFAGKGTFIKQHGYTSVDRDYFEKIIPPDNMNYSDWGVHDDHLLDYAYESFVELSKNNKPFVLSLLTLDTHHPWGHIPSRCINDKPYGDGTVNILNAVQCSDKLLAEFISKIQSSEAYKDTIIILQSDHLAMSNDALSILNEDPKSRKNLFVVLGANLNKQKVDRPGLLIDVGATILSFLGNNDGLGFGRSLLEDYDSGMAYAKFNQGDKTLSSYSNFSKNTWSFSTFLHGAEIKDNKVFLAGDKYYSLPALFVLKDGVDIDNVYFDEFNKHYLSLDNGTSYVIINSCNELGIKRDRDCFVFGEKNKAVSIHDFKNTASIKNVFFDKQKMTLVTSPVSFEGIYSFNSSNGMSVDSIYIDGDYQTIGAGVNLIKSNLDGSYEITNYSDCNDIKKISLDKKLYKSAFISFQYDTCMGSLETVFPLSDKIKKSHFKSGEYVLLKVDSDMFKNDILDIIQAPIKTGDVMAFNNNAEVVDLNRPIFGI